MQRTDRRRGAWLGVAAETARLALGSIRSQPLRSGLAIFGVVLAVRGRGLFGEELA